MKQFKTERLLYLLLLDVCLLVDISVTRSGSSTFGDLIDQLVLIVVMLKLEYVFTTMS